MLYVIYSFFFLSEGGWGGAIISFSLLPRAHFLPCRVHYGQMLPSLHVPLPNWQASNQDTRRISLMSRRFFVQGPFRAGVSNHHN